MIEMTTYEMLDLANSHAAGASDDFNRYLAIISAYLITAYNAGRALTKFQVSVINTGFVIFAGQCIAGMRWEMGEQTYYLGKAWGATSEAAAGGISFADMVQYAVGAALVGGIVAGLMFMWSVRHPKTE